MARLVRDGVEDNVAKLNYTSGDFSKEKRGSAKQPQGDCKKK